MKILLTGPTGILGSALYKYLKAKYEVIPFYHKDFDIRDQKITQEIKKESPDVLIHTAALTNVDYCQVHPQEAEDINIRGTKNLALACKDLDCSFIYISTDYVFDGKKGSPYIETDKPNPLSVYAKTKFEGEKIVSSLLKKYFIVRLSWLFGKKGRDFIDAVINSLSKKEELKIIGDKFSIPTYNKDISIALEYLFTNNNFGIYHITNSGQCSWFEWAQKILKIYGCDIRLKPIRLEEFSFKASRPKNTVLNCDKFFKLTGIRLRHWQEALKEYIQECYNN